ncbi:MAG: R3H domain-containing nucleic acid-binding protein [Syntrophobacteraceae bacterium]
MPEKQEILTDDLELLLAVMPPAIRERVEASDRLQSLLEVVLDLGRLPEARYSDSAEIIAPEQVSREDIHYVVSRIGRFGDDNRAGIERTLHRISALRNRAGAIVGLTCRVGRAVFGTVDILRDVVEAGKSILLLGRPGVGKTTLLREAARVLADDLGKRVIVVDTSNEIAGDGDIPHPGIGRARRMQVPSPVRQHAVMIEAVENHMPEVIVIDEIGTEAEALAARTIAERGVQLIATVHGNTLENLLQNPTLSDLVGGIQTVTLSDEEARRRGTQKTVLERRSPPTFNVLIEIQEKDRLAVHHNVGTVVDAFLRGGPLHPEIRMRHDDGRVEILEADERTDAEQIQPFSGASHETTSLPHRPRRRALRIFAYGVSRGRLDRAIQKFRAPLHIVEEVGKADLVLTLKSQEKRRSNRLREAEARGMPFYVLKSNTPAQIEAFVRSAVEGQDRPPGDEPPLREAEAAIAQVRAHGYPVELAPQNSHIRRLQHLLAEQAGLPTESRGRDPYRRVVVYPPVV